MAETVCRRRAPVPPCKGSNGVQRILITGGLGYLGGRVAQHLVRGGRWQVIVSTRSAAGGLDWLPEATIAQTDWQSDDSLRNACRSVAAIIHLAGMNAADCASDPVAALAFNAVGTARLLRAAVAAGVRRFIYVSTAHVYASPLRGVITEGSLPTNLHPYATSHKAAEDCVRLLHKRRTLEGIVVRLSNSFGAPANPAANCWMLLVNDLCRQAVERGELVLNSSGLQRRDFITLTDVCRAAEHLLQADAGSLEDGLFNLGGAWAPTVLEMAECVARCAERVCGDRPQISRPQPSPREDSGSLEFRIDRLARSGFALQGDADAEIMATLKFCRTLPQLQAIK
jgi:UDP-glucose 4-epimerase